MELARVIELRWFCIIKYCKSGQPMGARRNAYSMPKTSIGTQIANMEAALGRILDVDIAAETTNLAKRQILVQASASMVTQANAANQVALMLLQ